MIQHQWNGTPTICTSTSSFSYVLYWLKLTQKNYITCFAAPRFLDSHGAAPPIFFFFLKHLSSILQHWAALYEALCSSQHLPTSLFLSLSNSSFAPCYPTAYPLLCHPPVLSVLFCSVLLVTTVAEVWPHLCFAASFLRLVSPRLDSTESPGNLLFCSCWTVSEHQTSIKAEGHTDAVIEHTGW